MKNFDYVVTVDKTRHARLRVKPNLDFAHAKNLNLASVTLAELSACTANFPVVFVQSPENKVLRPVAMFGLRQGENLYYDPDGWDCTYVPLIVHRHPFLIGFDDREPDSKRLTMCLDKNSPFLSEDDGIALFDASGEPTAYLNAMNRTLQDIFDSEKVTEQFTRKLVALDLLAPFELILQGADGEVRKITGMQTVSERKLRALAPEHVQELHKLDFLPACYLILGSLFQLHKLMGRYQKQHLGQLNYRIELEPQPQGPAQ